MKMEKWDLYNAKREKSGITVCRGEIIPKGLYHLSVSVNLPPNGHGKTFF